VLEQEFGTQCGFDQQITVGRILKLARGKRKLRN
jgi:hypothetical protein